MKSLTRTILYLLIGGALGVSVAVGQGVLAERNDGATLPLEDLRTFTEVFAKIKSDYVEPVEDKVLLENAIRGMLTGLDPHSAYLVPEDYQDLQAGTSGEFGGLGIEVGMEDGFVKVIAPIDDTPAQRAGVEAGDLIIRLDDTPVKGMSLADAVNLMRGEPGTSIVLTIVREGRASPIRITIMRDVIQVTSVRSRTLEPGFGYVRISQFQNRTGENLRDAVVRLRGDAGDELRGLVLDLRNNPGGVLSAAVSVSDAFLNEGTIVYTEGRMDEAEAQVQCERLGHTRWHPPCRARQRGLRLGLGDCRRRPAGPQAGRDHRREDVRQGLGADDSAVGQRFGAEAHDRKVLHAVGGFDPGTGNRARHHPRSDGSVSSRCGSGRQGIRPRASPRERKYR